MLFNRYEEVSNGYQDLRPVIKSLINSISFSILQSKYVFQDKKPFQGR